jgi:ribonuclease P protein component
MLKRKERLSRDAFSRFFSAGKRVRSPYFDFIYTPHPTFHGSVVVSKKVALRATARNALRRQVYSLLRETAHTENKSGVCIVIMRPVKETVPRTQLKNELVRIYRSLTI